MITLPAEVTARPDVPSDWQETETAFLTWVLAPLIVVQVVYLSYFRGLTSDEVAILCNVGPAMALGIYLVQVFVRFRRELNTPDDEA